MLRCNAKRGQTLLTTRWAVIFLIVFFLILLLIIIKERGDAILPIA